MISVSIASTYRSWLAAPILLSLIFLITGCVSTGARQATGDQGLQQEHQTVWPAPPEKPRIRFVRSLKYIEDVTGEKPQDLRDQLLGKEEDNDLLFKKPYGVHSDVHGRVFVTDSGSPGLQVFDLESKTISTWGTSGPGALTKAVAVTSDSEGNIYVSDIMDKRVVVYDRDGKFLKAFGGENTLASPAGLVFIDELQQLYVVDVKKHQIIVFDRHGEVAFTIGERGQQTGQFNFPSHIARNAKGDRVYVADTFNFRVQVFKPDGSFVTTFGRNGNTAGTFTRLKGIGVDTDGHIYAVDASFNNIQILDDQGQLLLFVGRTGRGPDGFYLPAGAHVDGNNRIYVADQYNQRIQVFEYLGE